MTCPAVPCRCCASGVVLAAASPYFETLLRGWACSQQPLHMVVGDDQLTAAQQLLAFMYTGGVQRGEGGTSMCGFWGVGVGGAATSPCTWCWVTTS